MSDIATHSPIESPTQISSPRRLWAWLRSVPWGVWLLVFVIGHNIVGFAERLSDARDWVHGSGYRVIGQPFEWWVIVVSVTVFFGLNLLGLYHRHPFIRLLWAALLFVLLAAIVVNLVALIVLPGSSSDARWTSLLPIAFFVAVFIGLHTRSTRRWFGLICPACGSRRVGAANLLYSRLRCNGCKHRWHRHHPHAVDVTVFE